MCTEPCSPYLSMSCMTGRISPLNLEVTSYWEG